MPRRASDIAIAVLFALVLAGPGLVLACEAAGVALPSWATAEDAKWLAGGSRSSGLAANLSPGGFASGGLQDAVEGEVADRVPFKAAAMLADAGWQRGAIALADAPLGYPCYPTYYGSSRLHVPGEDAVTYLPYKRSEEKLAAIRALGEGVAEVAGRNPGRRFSVVLVQGYQEPAASPAYALVSDPVDPAEYASAAAEGVGDAPNAHLFSESYGSAGEYYRDFFRTDHHWNWRGVARAYGSMARELGLSPFEAAGEAPIEGYAFTGATARWGRDLVSERVSDAAQGPDGVTVEGPDGGRVPYGHESFYARDDPGKRYAFYDSYYSVPSVLYGPGEGRALVVANSYGGGIAPYIAQNYAETRVAYQVQPAGRDSEARLQETLDDLNVDDVFVVANPTDLAGFVSQCPEYFDSN